MKSNIRNLGQLDYEEPSEESYLLLSSRGSSENPAEDGMVSIEDFEGCNLPSPKPYLTSNETSIEKPTSFKLIKKDKPRKKQSKEKKRVSKSKQDYRKNICGYITKKCMRQFTSEVFLSRVRSLCEKESVNVDNCLDYYRQRIEKVTGPSHLSSLLIPENPQNQKMVHVFKEFFEWFLKERYIRCLLSSGKMEKKEDYILYKNKFMLQLIRMPNSKEDHSSQLFSNN